MKDNKTKNDKKTDSTKKKLRIAGIAGLFALLRKKLGSKKKVK